MQKRPLTCWSGCSFGIPLRDLASDRSLSVGYNCCIVSPRLESGLTVVSHQLFHYKGGAREGCPLPPRDSLPQLQNPWLSLLDPQLRLGDHQWDHWEKLCIRRRPLTSQTCLTHWWQPQRLQITLGPFRVCRSTGLTLLLFPLSQPVPSPTVQIPLTWVSKFRYLRIEVQKEHSLYLADNVYPVLQQLTSRCQAWKSLPSSPVGRIILLKMTFLPKFLFVISQYSNPNFQLL